MSKLNVIDLLKIEAVEKEDFDLALAIKEVGDSLRLMGSDLITLENKKKNAIA